MRLLRRYRSRFENNTDICIEMHLKDLVCKLVFRIQVAQKQIRCWDTLKISILAQQKTKLFFNQLRNYQFLRQDYIYILWNEVASDEFTALLNKCLSGRSVQRSSFEIQFQNTSFACICSLKYCLTKITLRHAIFKIR